MLTVFQGFFSGIDDKLVRFQIFSSRRSNQPALFAPGLQVMGRPWFLSACNAKISFPQLPKKFLPCLYIGLDSQAPGQFCWVLFLFRTVLDQTVYFWLQLSWLNCFAHRFRLLAVCKAFVKFQRQISSYACTASDIPNPIRKFSCFEMKGIITHILSKVALLLLSINPCKKSP